MTDYDDIRVGKQNRRDANDRAEKNRKDWGRSGQPPATAHKPTDLSKKKKRDARKAKEYHYDKDD